MVNVEKDIREYSGLELAYIGDAVWEIKMREHYLSFGYSIFKLNKEVKAKVNAKFQSLVYNKIIDSLDEKFQTIGKRAKNSNIKTFPKSCTVMEYKEATALEAIIGAMYLLKKEEDINKIINLVIEGERNGNF
ncbi:ribonuclease III domain-containing protein [Fusobacterium massiliense]|jgi:RNase3 domain-containing protein|uniref:Mini-ribonuclease 3 n=1 Tax=Fusobacterium massiliense TaxID=1852365 RepID=UPI0028F023CE|nr:ribonuclease III domain-containing protein [Fusobacterium massiliense]